jgi:hypothetical protein
MKKAKMSKIDMDYTIRCITYQLQDILTAVKLYDVMDYNQYYIENYNLNLNKSAREYLNARHKLRQDLIKLKSLLSEDMLTKKR